jgi:hypothetical protein
MTNTSEITWSFRGWRIFAVTALLLMTPILGGAEALAAVSSDAHVSIDASGFPNLVVTAENARIVDILQQIGEQFGFSIENSPSDDRRTATGTFHGELKALLQSDMLGQMSFVMLGTGDRIERLVIVGYDHDSAGPKGDAGATVASLAEPKPGQIGPSRPASSPDRAVTGAPRQPAAPPGRLNRLLRDQAIQGTGREDDRNGAAQADGPARPAGASAGDPSLAAMMQAAHANAQTLATALRAACIGPNCAR